MFLLGYDVCKVEASATSPLQYTAVPYRKYRTARVTYAGYTSDLLLQPNKNPWSVAWFQGESCKLWSENFSSPYPYPTSHSNHQLERLFIGPLLPSASSSSLSTPVSFLSCSLLSLVSRAVGQRERDVTGTENVRKRGMREVCSKQRDELRT